MHDTSPSEIQPSLLERLAQLSSDDLHKMIHSKGAGKMEKFLVGGLEHDFYFSIH